MLNNVVLIGRLTRDPENSTTNNGVEYAKFSLAVQRDFRNAEGEYDADFINCIAWRGTAEFIGKWFRKGDPIAIVGSIQTRNYEADDGTRRYVTEVLANKASFTGAPKEQGNEEDSYAGMEPISDDDLPF